MCKRRYGIDVRGIGKLWKCFAAILPAMVFISCLTANAATTEKMEQDQRMAWWDEAKFGMFIHWGVYADLAGVWKGEPVKGYSEHIMRLKKIPLETYKKEVAANFNPTNFNAEEWVKLCKAAGMKYMVITSKHHDGFAMFDTNVKGWENYDIVDGTKFKRDPMVELKKACDKHGIKFGFYYSHAQDWSHEYGQRNNWDFNHPTERGNWYDLEKWQEHKEKSMIYVTEKSIPQMEEILSKKYDPDLIWFDTRSWLPNEYNKIILTRAREVADPKVIFNSRSAEGFADYLSTCDKPDEFKPVEDRYWEAIPTTNESYGYHRMDKTHKPASHFIILLSKAAARGGNLLMNVGPKGDGTIDKTDVDILTGIGDWLKVNGDAIYGTKKTPLPVQAWGQTSVKENKLYLHIHDYPKGVLTLGGLKNKVKKAYFLADAKKKALAVKKDKSGDLEIKIPAKKSDEPVTIVVLESKGAIEYDGTSRLLAKNQVNTLHVFDGKIQGNGLRYGSGNHRGNFVTGWNNKEAMVSWDCRISDNAEYNVFVIYDSEASSDKNQYEVIVGGNSLKANVIPKAGYKKILLGTVNLTKGENPVSVKATKISTRELMKLRAVVLEPAGNTPASAEKSRVERSIDWGKFLGRHDLHWTRMPTTWKEAPFLGNGMMGTMVRQIDDHAVRWDVGRGDVQDHRPGGGMYGTCRLPIGYFLLKTAGTIKGGTMKLDLWNAEATGEIQTDRGSIRWQSLVHAERMVILTILEPSEGERGCHWQWKSLAAISPRQASGRNYEGYKNNPPAVLTKDGNANVCIQPLLVGGETATAWIVDKQEDKSVLMVSVAHSFPGTTARQEAVDVLNSTRDVPMDKLMKSHRRWWHNYYPKSFVSIPDTEWESFYWIQMYKLASATRADGMLIDNQGPWLQPTPWPGAWWNLNVQLAYWPTYDSNRLGLGSSLCRTLYTNVKTLIDNVPEEYRSDSAGITRATGQHCRGGVGAPDGENAPEIGLLLWACHNCWLHYRHTMDDETLRNDLFPLLRRAVNYHLHFVTKDAGGTLHLPKTYSPEYNYAKGPDCNFDLALFRWGCSALIDICDRLSIDDPLLSKWKGVVKDLTNYQTDENGYMIARDVPFARKHRHYSHLLMLYPLYLVNVEQAGAKELAVKSVRHWQSFGKSTGYALTGASSISSAFGLGNDALEYLNGLKSFLQPNTLYFEGPGWPVIETPLSGAQCIHDMIVQSWGGTIRVFPAAPDAWADIVFDDLRTQGAFLVSARRTKGKTQFVRIKSLAGEPCTIMPGLDGKIQVAGSRKFNLSELKPGLFELDIKKGEQAILFSGDKMPDLKITPVPAEESKCNSFGLNFSAETVKLPPFVIEEALDIAEVPSGFPVGFSLLTAGKRQYVAYYDKHHRMTVASRSLDSNKWQYQVLPSKVGWDSHNYITMAVDRDGHLHVSGNMHCVKLIYFRTDKPGDITTLKRYAMTGEAEDKVTYPKFLTDKQGELIFNYRDGSSGNGRRIYNKYNRNTRSWSRLMDKPLLDGEGKRNAYPMGPVRGPNGWFHIVWVWRDTPDCATNHHLSYARSKDLIHWESASGEKVELPMTLGNKLLCVDPIESGGGIINGCQRLIFDIDNRPIITYHKSDTKGNMQIYAARFEDGNWTPHRLTDWSKPVKFSGYGSMGFIGIKISKLTRVPPGILTMTYRHRDYGDRRLVIDEKTLRPINKKITTPRGYPEEMIRPQIDFKGIEIQRTGDIGTSGEEGIHYVLQWETLGRNFDRPRKPPLPKPSTLRLYKLSARD